MKMLRAFAVMLILAGALASHAAAPTAPPVPPTITGVIGYSVDSKLEDLVFVFSDGTIAEVSAADCVADKACEAAVEQLIAIKHVKLIDVSTGEKV